MPTNLGNSVISSSYLGSTAVNKIYLGVTEVYSSVQPLTLTYIGESLGPTDGTTFTFNSVNIGTASTDRLVIAVVHARGNNPNVTLNSVTSSLGAMTKAVGTYFSYANTDIFYQVIPSGTTSNFTATYSLSKAGCDLDIYTLTGWTSLTPSDTASNGVTSSVNSITLDIPVGSIAIYGYTQQSGTVTGTFSSATETYDNDLAGESTCTTIGGYLADAGTGHTETLTATGGNPNIFVGAVWG